MSIRRQFVLVFAVFAVVLAAAFGWVVTRISSQALEAELDRRLTDVAGAVAATGFDAKLLLSLQPGEEDELAWLATHNRLTTLRERYVSGAWIFSGLDFGALVTAEPADSIPIGAPLRFLEPYEAEVRFALRDGRASSPAFSLDGRLFKYGFVRLEGVPGAILAVLMPADYLAPVARMRNALLVGTVLALALAVGLGAVLARTVARPLEKLSRAALRIQRGRLDRPVRLDRKDELGRLAQAMERMRKGVIERDEQLHLMLAQVAHEIRNPLGGLELFAAAAAQTDDVQERGGHMGRVREEVAALNRIIDDFLTFARPLPSELEPVDLRVAVEAASWLVRGELESEGGRLEVRLPQEPLMARADADQVKRAILNLLRNAAQVSDHVVVSGRSERGEVVISVADDGPGVSEEARSRIFDPFVTDKEQGAGLGLAIVKKVAEAHGGRVDVGSATTSGIGLGAEFKVYFRGMEDFSTA